MIGKLIVIMTVVASITESTVASPSPHDHNNDPYEPIIRLLKEARKQRKYERLGSASSQNSQFQYPTSSGSNSGGGGGNGGGNGGGGSPPNPILTPGGNNGNFGTIGSALSRPAAGGGSSGNYGPILPNFPSGSQIVGQLGNGNFPVRPHYPIEQVNRGVSTILGGVRSFDLGQILRGAFIFPRNENVRSVANNVLDSIFGQAKQSTGGARI